MKRIMELHQPRSFHAEWRRNVKICCSTPSLGYHFCFPSPPHSPSPLRLNPLPRFPPVSLGGVTALVHGIMVCNSLPAPLRWSGGPLMYNLREGITPYLCACKEKHLFSRTVCESVFSVLSFCSHANICLFELCVCVSVYYTPSNPLWGSSDVT